MVYWQIICGAVVAWQIVYIFESSQLVIWNVYAKVLFAQCEHYQFNQFFNIIIITIIIVCNVNFWYANIALYVQ